MMLSRLRSVLLALVILLLILLITVAACLPAYLLIILKILLPRRRLRLLFARGITWITGIWMKGMVWLQTHLLPTRWEIEYEGDLSLENSYLVIANHQSWADILVLFQTLTGRVPFPRFFLKPRDSQSFSRHQ